MPETLVLRPSRTKWALVALGSLVFTMLGIWMLTSNPSAVIAWLCVIFFGALCLPAALVQFLPGICYLQVNQDGLFIKAPLKKRLYQWDEIVEFGVAEIQTGHGSQSMVGINFTEEYHARAKNKTMRNLNRKVSGYHDSLPDTYGVPVGELAQRLNQLQRVYTQGPALDPMVEPQGL